MMADPAFACFDRHVLLSGYSGACIGIVHHQGQVFVRKVARSPGGSQALRRQRERQVALAALLQDSVGMPEVLRDGEVDGRYFFDMRWISGRDGATFLGSASFDDIRSFSARLETVVEQLAALPSGGTAPGRAPFDAKLQEICARTLGRHDLSDLGRLVERVPEQAWPAEGSGMHGDLTLENILVDGDGKIWLIDSIDGPFEHYWQDVAKLCQDLEGHWHVFRGRPIATSVTAWLRTRLLACVHRHDPLHALVHYPLLALTFARILPYAADDAGRSFVAARVASFTAAGHLILDREIS